MKNFSVSNIGRLTSFTNSEQPNWTTYYFTAIVGNTAGRANISDCDRFAIVSKHHGVIPLMKHAWDPNTNVVSLKFNQSWFTDVYDPAVQVPDALPMQAILDATTIIYGAEQITTFRSAGVAAQSIHIENADCLTRVCFVQGGWQVSAQSRLQDIY